MSEESTRTAQIIDRIIWKEFTEFLPTDNLREFINVSYILMNTDNFMGRIEADEASELASAVDKAIKLIKKDSGGQ